MPLMRDDMFFDEIIRPMQESMIACIWRVTQSHEDAQDALQEALWTIWRKRRKVAKHPKPKALILKICRAKAIDSLRKSIRRAEHELPCVSSTETPCDPRVSASPDEELHSKDVVARVRRVVSLLPRKRAQAVFMRLVEEQPYADIALSLGCSEATVRSHVRRGRTHLQKALRHINGLDVE